jgi:hypothetical protein
MNDDDALSRAKRALQASQPRRSELDTSLPDQSELNRLLAQAREAAEDRPRSQVIARSKMAIATGPETGRLFQARKAKSGRWICAVCGVPGCMFDPKWVVDE